MISPPTSFPETAISPEACSSLRLTFNCMPHLTLLWWLCGSKGEKRTGYMQKPSIISPAPEHLFFFFFKWIYTLERILRNRWLSKEVNTKGMTINIWQLPMVKKMKVSLGRVQWRHQTREKPEAEFLGLDTSSQCGD